MSINNLIEVFRKVPVPGKFYLTGIYEIYINNYPNKRYYADINKLTYVGKHINKESWKYGDIGGVGRVENFVNGNTKHSIVWNNEDTTIFLEVPEMISKET